MSTHVQIHRFYDSVAVYLGTGVTVYFSSDDATAIANALRAACLDIKNNMFSHSQVGTFNLDYTDNKYK